MKYAAIETQKIAVYVRITFEIEVLQRTAKKCDAS